jgi:hypothetical protein
MLAERISSSSSSQETLSVSRLNPQSAGAVHLSHASEGQLMHRVWFQIDMHTQLYDAANKTYLCSDIIMEFKIRHGSI